MPAAHGRACEEYSFHGAHQPGITTEMQDHLHFATFDVTTESRHELVARCSAWTVAASG